MYFYDGKVTRIYNYDGKVSRIDGTSVTIILYLHVLIACSTRTTLSVFAIATS
jgi:hypothetical protein